MSSSFELPIRQVHVWQVAFHDVAGIDLTDRYVAMLDSEETQRYRRFLFERDRRAYAIAHALVRTVLSSYAGVAPEAWTFVANAHGRPEISEPAAYRHLRFNLSHTRGAAIFGAAVNCELGVDVESLERNSPYLELAERFFSPTETRGLATQSPERRRDAFFHYWTLKESYIKARGFGLAIPLDQFSFHFGGPGPIGVEFAPSLADDSTAWQFQTWRFDERFQAAAAVRCADPPRREFVVRRVVPLMSIGEPTILTAQ